MDRADRHNTRPAVERQEYKVGDLVDLWYEPLNKDTSGWRGPGKVHSLQPNEGVVTVRYQGRSLDRRAQEVRPHIPYVLGLFQHAATSSRPLGIREMRRGRPRNEDVQNIWTGLGLGNKSGLATHNQLTV